MSEIILSAVVLTKNEEANLKECLNCLRFADEVIIVDDYSQDKTLEIARRHGAKVFRRRLGEDFSEQRNYGLERASGRWVLFVDADERVDANLQKEILSAVKRIETVGYYIVRKDRIFGRFLRFGEFFPRGGFGNARLLRLARKGAGRWKRAVHEYWDISGKCRSLKSPLFHYPHPTLREFVSEINLFSTIHAKEILREGKKPSLAKVLIWPLGKFLYNMVLRLGFLDGMRGFVVAIVMSFHSFLAWSKAWIKQGRL
jgi:glycosyltransferase involved in cell wall biosynthesis